MLHVTPALAKSVCIPSSNGPVSVDLCRSGNMSKCEVVMVERFQLRLNVKQAVREAARICPRPCKLTFDIFDLESSVRVTRRKLKYVCAVIIILLQMNVNVMRVSHKQWYLYIAY